MIATRPGYVRTSWISRSTSATGMPVAVAARAGVNASNAAAQRDDLVGVTVIAQLIGIGAVGKERGGDRAEDRDVAPGSYGEVLVGRRGGFGPTGVEDPDPTAATAVLAQVPDRIGQRGAVTV